MNARLYKIMEARYLAELEEAKYKLELLAFFKTGVIIPEHTDVTGEVDKLLGDISSADEIFCNNLSTSPVISICSGISIGLSTNVLILNLASSISD